MAKGSEGKLKFKDALLMAANSVAGGGCAVAKKLAVELRDGKIKPAVLDQVANGVAVFLPKYRTNTNVAALDWSQHLPLLEKAIEVIAHKLGL